ncbi:hypothetical protein [Clostridium mediterraneense]|uniref:hypothetical protein n=1 Tax=Clostridium mediterraneense TaxID=1805472 RepID=UPI000829E54F|nr:hypothetical protein [Clostridium mediterraneense]
MLDIYKMKGYEDLESEKNYYNVEVLPNKRTIYKLFTLQTNMKHMYSTPEADDLIINLKENLDILC